MSLHSRIIKKGLNQNVDVQSSFNLPRERLKYPKLSASKQLLLIFRKKNLGLRF